MLLPLLLTFLLCAGGCYVVARVTMAATRRLRLDPWETLVWFGIADDLTDEPLAAASVAPVIPLRLPHLRS